MIFVGSTDLLAERRTSRFIDPLLRWLFQGISDEAVNQAVYYIRKCGHVTEYGLLAILVLAALGRTFRPLPLTWSWKTAGWALLICAGYAAADEFHQSFVPSRYSSPLDVVIDTCGAATVVALIWAWGRLRRRW